MAPDAYNPWDTTDGLPSTFEGKIVDASFMYDPKYNNSQTLLCSLTVERTDDDGAGQEISLMYPLGPGWSEIGGETAVHENGPTTKFNKQTAYGEFVSRVAQLLPATELSHRDPHQAKDWLGLVFYFERITAHREFTVQSGPTAGKKVTRDVTRTWPTKYLGESKGSSSGGAAAAPMETVALTGGGMRVIVNSTVAAQAQAFAKALDYNAWVKRMLEDPAVLSDDSLVSAVGTEAFYEALRTS